MCRRPAPAELRLRVRVGHPRRRAGHGDTARTVACRRPTLPVTVMPSRCRTLTLARYLADCSVTAPATRSDSEPGQAHSVPVYRLSARAAAGSGRGVRAELLRQSGPAIIIAGGPESSVSASLLKLRCHRRRQVEVLAILIFLLVDCRFQVIFYHFIISGHQLRSNLRLTRQFGPYMLSLSLQLPWKRVSMPLALDSRRWQSQIRQAMWLEA